MIAILCLCAGREKEEQLTKRAQERAAERQRQKDEKGKEEGGVEEARGSTPLASGPRPLSTIYSREGTGLSGDMMFEPHDTSGALLEEGEDAIAEEVCFQSMKFRVNYAY